LRFEQRNLQIEGNNSTCYGNVVEGSMMLFGMHAGLLFVGGGERDQVELSQALPQEENKLQIRDCQRQLCSYCKNIFPFSKQNPKSCKIS
jgi:hypothetical protein